MAASSSKIAVETPDIYLWKDLMPFKYQPLEDHSSIRLLEILPDRINGCITCKLRHVKRDHNTQIIYTALSYCWGDPTPRHTIVIIDCDGRPHPHPLHDSLWQFLDQMWQNQETNRYYWTDSLCINQQDNDEKNHQVTQMGLIYAHAKEVLIFLGRNQDGEDALGLIANHVSDAYPPFGMQEDPRIYRRKYYSALRIILQLEYWLRVWVVQEIVLAKKATMIYGQSSCDFCALARCLQFEDYEYRSILHSEAIKHIISIYQMKSMALRETLWQVLGGFLYCRSTKLIDGVYGFLGLVAGGPKFSMDNLEVNYEKEPYEVLWDAVFESGISATEYGYAVIQIAIMLGLQDGFDPRHTLEQYVINQRTSLPHALCGQIALRTMRVANTIISKCVFNDLWTETLVEISKNATETDLSTSQNAAILGLMLGSGDLEYQEATHGLEDPCSLSNHRGDARDTDLMAHIKRSIVRPSSAQTPPFCSIATAASNLFIVWD